MLYSAYTTIYTQYSSIELILYLKIFRSIWRKVIQSKMKIEEEITTQNKCEKRGQKLGDIIRSSSWKY